MILFKKDWERYPAAITHNNTKNASWLRTAAVYKRLGVENYNFHLSLLNPDIANLDPYDPNLTLDQQVAIVTEAKDNIWYMLREVIRIPAIAAVEPVMLRGDRANISLYWLFFNHITTSYYSIRQLAGKSTAISALITALFSIATVNTNLNLLTKDNDLRVDTLSKVKDMIDELPFYFQLRTKKDAYNTEKLTLERLGNTLHTNVAQASVKAAIKIGRGMTLAINFIDEFAFIKNIEHTLPTMLSASVAARKAAKEAGAHYGNIFTSTPGYLSSAEGKYAKKMYDESFKWTEKLFDTTDRDSLEDHIRRNNTSGKVFVLLEYNHRQLGYTDAELREAIESAAVDKETIGPEFLLKWSEGNATSPIDKEYLKQINASLVPEPRVEVSSYGYILRWYVNEDTLPMRKYVIGLDTSDAVGGDDIALVIRDASNGGVISTGKYNETNLIKFSRWIAELTEEHENATVVIERRSSGVAIIDNLLLLLPAKGIDPFRRLFNWVTDDAHITRKYMDEIFNVSLNKRSSEVYEKYRKHFGYATSGSGRTSRDNLYGEALVASAKYTASLTKDNDIINQLNGLTIRNNRIDHGAGHHDDMVIAWLICYWFLSKAKNKVLYGLQPSLVLSNITEAKLEERGGVEGIRKKAKQLAIKREVDGYIEKLKKTKDPMMSTRLLTKIKHLNGMIDTSVVDNYNIESIIENIKINTKKTYKPLRISFV